MTRAIRLHAPGGPEAMKLEDVSLPAPGPGEVRLRQTAVGVNFIDVYHRSGVYPLPLPSGLGTEGAGVVEAVGPSVAGLAPGDRVAYAASVPGAYAEAVVMPADRLVRIPEGVSDEQAASVMLKGMTVQYLVTQTYRVRRGDTVLLHAAAGGVGLIACQWLDALGATVIGTVGTDEKAALARAHGCRHAIVYSRERFRERVMEITEGRGVEVVYDSVGRDTIEDSFACLKPLGTLALFGASSGAVESVPVAWIQKGSHFFTRPSLFAYIATPAELARRAADVFEVLRAGRVKVNVGARYRLADAAQAHRDLEARRSTGSLLLVP
jgi:NADPH2:quinone reductase